jgi:hypothetical protein
VISVPSTDIPVPFRIDMWDLGIFTSDNFILHKSEMGYIELTRHINLFYKHSKLTFETYNLGYQQKSLRSQIQVVFPSCSIFSRVLGRQVFELKDITIFSNLYIDDYHRFNER